MKRGRESLIKGTIYQSTNYRIKYHPNIHVNQRKYFTEEELAYICFVWGSSKKRDIALVLGRTHGSILTKVNLLEKNGQFDYFKGLGRSFYDVNLGSGYEGYVI